MPEGYAKRFPIKVLNELKESIVENQKLHFTIEIMKKHIQKCEEYSKTTITVSSEGSEKSVREHEAKIRVLIDQINKMNEIINLLEQKLESQKLTTEIYH